MPGIEDDDPDRPQINTFLLPGLHRDRARRGDKVRTHLNRRPNHAILQDHGLGQLDRHILQDSAVAADQKLKRPAVLLEDQDLAQRVVIPRHPVGLAHLHHREIGGVMDDLRRKREFWRGGAAAHQ